MLLENSVSQNLAIEELESIDRAEALRSEWTALWERCANGTPFQTPEWQLAWWNAFGTDKKLYLLLVRQAETCRLVALLPTMILPEQSKLMFAGAAVSDELDILAEPEFVERAAQIFMNRIRNQHHRWKECEFQPLPEHSPFRDGAKMCDVTPIVDLEKPIPANMRHNLGHYRRRAEKFGSIEFRSASQENFDELFNALIDLHCAEWNRRHEAGVLCGEIVRHFHTRAARALLRRGIARIYALCINGRIVAGWYGFICRAQMWSYIGGFDPDLRRLSLGTLILGHAIAEAKREGANKFNFLRGAERYKRHWGAKDHYVYSRQFLAS